MDDAVLREAILADPTCKALANAGNDDGCAIAVSGLLPKVLTSNHVTERGLYDAFPDPAEAEALLQGLAAIGGSNAVVARVASWLKPDQGGLDFGNPTVRATIDTLAKSAPTVFTASRVAILKALGETGQTVTHFDVSRALAPLRKDGEAKLNVG